MLKEYIEELVNEVLGGFNLSKFKAIAATNEREEGTVGYDGEAPSESQATEAPEVQYAKKLLPYMGKGSSRITFALSSSKVLKIALNQAGEYQNQAEVDIWSNSRSPYLTQVYDFSPDNRWLIAEIVKVIEPQDLYNILNISPRNFGEALFARPNSIEEFRNNYEHRNEFLLKDNASVEAEIRTTQENGGNPSKFLLRKRQKNKETIASRQSVLDSKAFMGFFENIINLTTTYGILWQDIRVDHFGRNVQGQIKLLDFGLDLKTSREFY